MFLVVLIGVIYILIGFCNLFTSLLFIQLGRPKDLITSGLLILLGTFLIIYQSIFTLKVSFILILNALLINFFFIENFLYRWNQLLDKEKFDIKSLSGFKRNLSIIYRIIRLDLNNIFLNNKIVNVFKNTSIQKKWVRKQADNNSSDKEPSSKEYINNIQTTDFSKKDIINDEKIKFKNIKIDK